MMFPQPMPQTPHLACREYVRHLEPEYSLLWRWSEKADEWREHLRPKLVELLGFPEQKCDLQIRELETIEGEGFNRIRLAYNVEDGVGACAWVCVPEKNEEPLPAIVCAHPRGSGKDELVGLTGEAPADAHAAYADELARQGYVVLVPDARCFGERLGDEAGLSAVGDLLGRPLVGMQVWDLLRAVDYLAQRPDVRLRRIGVAGQGMGAIHALFLAAVDERIACAAVCGGVSTYRELIVARDCFTQCAPPRDTVPGLLRYADLDDIACLIAPRALMIVQGRQDSSVPPAGAEECIERVRAGYRLMGEQVRFEGELVDGGDVFHAEPLLKFLDDWLKLPEPDVGGQVSK